MHVSLTSKALSAFEFRLSGHTIRIALASNSATEHRAGEGDGQATGQATEQPRDHGKGEC